MTTIGFIQFYNFLVLNEQMSYMNGKTIYLCLSAEFYTINIGMQKTKDLS